MDKEKCLAELQKFNKEENVFVRFSSTCDRRREEPKEPIRIDESNGNVIITIYNDDTEDEICTTIAKANEAIDKAVKFRNYYLNPPSGYEYLRRNVKEKQMKY